MVGKVKTFLVVRNAKNDLIGRLLNEDSRGNISMWPQI